MNATSKRSLGHACLDGAIIELETHVQSRVGRRLREFRLVIEEGGLVLHGRSSTYYVKQLAQHAIMEASETPIVANEIQVF
jgi:hypothetical protein